MRRLVPLVALLAAGASMLPSAGRAAPTPTPTATPAASAGPTSAPAVPGDALDQQLAAALADQQAVAAAKASLQAEVIAAQSQQSQLAQLVLDNLSAVQSTEKQIATEQHNLEDAASRAAMARDAAARAAAQAANDRTMLALTLRSQYEGGSDMVLTYLVSSTSFSDLISRISQAAQLGGSVERMSAALDADQRAAVAQQLVAQTQEERARTAAAALQQQDQTLQAQVSTERDLIGKLDAQSRAAMHEVAALNGQTAALAQQIVGLRIAQLDQTIADAEQAAWDAATYWVQQHLGALPGGASSAGGPSMAAQLAAAQGQLPPSYASGATRLVWPAPGTVISQWFGPSSFTFEPPMFGVPHFHTGVDLAGPTGTPIYAAAGGVVATAQTGSTGYGNHIVIAVDGHMLALYGHLETMVVQPGQRVAQGQLIALMGSTGNSTGSHLHFEVRVDGVPINPSPLLPALAPGAPGPPPLPH